jgi:class 3 adenylate cyclase
MLQHVSGSSLDVKYARSGGVHVAYAVVGDGPTDLVMVEGFLTHLAVQWEEPTFRRFVERLAGFTRVICFDKRGMGLSDRVEAGTLEDRMDDVRAVMDAVGAERAAVMGSSEGGPLSLLFAATYPERTQCLLLVGAEVCEEKSEDWPWGEQTRQEFDEYVYRLPQVWGQLGLRSEVFAPSLDPAESARLYEWSRRLLLNAASPSAAMAFSRMAFDIDVREVCTTIDVPTLVLHRAGDRVCHVENARFLSRTIATSTYHELDGADHIVWMNPEGAEEVSGLVQEYLTGTREAAAPQRVLATVLFTDLVDSTATMASLGDSRWRTLIEQHHAVVRGLLERFRGRELDTAGDGFLATFDGPARAIRCATAIVQEVGRLGLRVRAGIHTGECDIVDGKLGGIAVHIGARVAALAGPGEVLTSGTVRDLVAGSGISFSGRGVHHLRGVPGEWRLYAVDPA